MKILDILKIKKDLSSFYESAIEDMAITSHILEDKAVKNYILNKITAKILNYPEFLSFFWKTPEDFYKFEKALKGEIWKHYLNLIKAAGNFKENSKVDKDLRKAVYAFFAINKYRTISIFSKKSASGDDDRELIDFIPDTKADEPSRRISLNEEYEEETAGDDWTDEELETADDYIYAHEDDVLIEHIENLNIKTAYHTEHNTKRQEQLDLF